ncbi:hypothetical protein [Azohydromonas aeria]|uniref:hypothetical protein n=1 Tax=Azohydromonas aeria TaxID=2590212 RepID=UPI0012FC1C23|nr:hypothetical protein [Azohydromonas aeria]
MIREARELLRLRALRVERLRARCAEAQAAVEEALRVVREREAEVHGLRAGLDALARGVVGALAPSLPRWIEVAAAERERLADLLERAEYGLIDDEHALEAAQEQQQQVRAELTRALAGQDAVRSLMEVAQRERAQAAERRLELEVEDQGRPRH